MRKIVAVIWLVILWPLLSQSVPAVNDFSKQVRGEVNVASRYVNEAKSDLESPNLGASIGLAGR
jgi:hypothetical protein